MANSTELRAPTKIEVYRRKVHLDCFYRLCEVKQDVEELHCPTLNDEQLRSFSICRLEDLDIDETGACDSAPRYFSPLPEDAVPELDLDNHVRSCWEERCSTMAEEGKLNDRDEEVSSFPSHHICNRFHEGWRTVR